jgi:hypothetical protein
MTQDEIIEMAKQAGYNGPNIALFTMKDLETFTKLVAQHEREACSSIASDYAQRLNSMTAVNIADAIRARGQA